MESTLDVYKIILDNNEDLYHFIENYHQLINKVYYQKSTFEKSEILTQLNETFIEKSQAFKADFLLYIHKMARIHLEFEESWKEYEKEIQNRYLQNYFFSANSNQGGEWVSKTYDELYKEASKDIPKPEEYDVFKSVDSYLRVPNFRYLLSLKDSLPEDINTNSFIKIFEIYNSHKKGDLKDFLDDIVNFYKKHKSQSHKVSSVAVNVFLNKLENSSVENEICEYLLGRLDYTITLAEPIGEYINDFVESKPEKEDWITLFKLFHSDSHKTQPSKKNFIEITNQIEKIGIEDYSSFVYSTLEVFHSRLLLFHANYCNQALLENTNQAIIRGIFFSISNLKNPKINKMVLDCSILCLKKVKNIGALLVKIGNSGLMAFSYLPYELGKNLLSLSKETIKYPLVSVKAIQNSISQLAKFSGKSIGEIEDSGMPSFGFSKDNIYEIQIGDFVFCSKEIKDLKLGSSWKTLEGTIINKLPESFKSEYLIDINEELKNFKEAQTALNNYKNRIELFFTQKRKWIYSDWESNFLENGFIGIISKKLIWFFEINGKSTTGFLLNNQWLNSEGNPISWINSTTNIELWHPLGFENEIIIQWKIFLEKWKIRQPFKQVYREVYLITDAEIETINFSNRFSSNILLNYQFGALLKSRNWRDYNQFHDGGHPKLTFNEYKINAILGVEFLERTDRWGDLAVTDKVSFYNSNGPIDLINVPAIIFSEVMRDIDLFISVSGVGNDPDWVVHQINTGLNFNSQYVFGDLLESAKNRKNILMSIIPKLKIASKLELNGNFLIVKGKLRTYKIHIGSSNILMEPNNQYLCIVPDSSPKKNQLDKSIYLPYEGDIIFSMIISKAFLLADDDKIIDKQILNQINYTQN